MRGRAAVPVERVAVLKLWIFTMLRGANDRAS